MHTLRLLMFAAGVAGAAAQCSGQCPNGYKDGAGDCDACDAGFRRNDAGMCGSGRPETPCSDDAGAEFPYWGCYSAGTQLGKCSVDRQGNKVFPCECAGYASCEQAYADNEKAINKKFGGDRCFPVGARMVTTFPNEPLVNEKFDVTIVTCKSASSDEYLLIPASQDCEQMPRDYAPSAGCRMIAGGEETTVEGECLEGALLVQLQQGQLSDRPRAGLKEVSFRNLKIASNEPREFKVCSSIRLGTKPDTVAGWATVPSHNEYDADKSFRVCTSLSCEGDGPVSSAAGGGDAVEDDCCEELLLGGACIPNWVVFIIFVLLLLVLGVLLYRRNALQNKLKSYALAMQADKSS